jgi:hypothetical protein
VTARPSPACTTIATAAVKRSARRGKRPNPYEPVSALSENFVTPSARTMSTTCMTSP